MAFYFNNKLSVDIENKQYTIDLSTNKVIEAIEKIRDESLKVAKNPNNSEQDILQYVETMKAFVSEVIGEEATKEIIGKSQLNIEDLAELTHYILSEIEQFKTKKMKDYSQKYTPEKLN
ncbi:MAG: hypothetical protein RR916_06130 [Anaerorhabdus sp.]